ncbi:flippase [Shewanella sp.]|uniref:flippase n=1 Tax=Shewanella sp. TaxID=50422 RepID=UPI003D0FBFF4
MKKNSFKSDVKYLGIVQILNYLAPAVTFPYLTRIFGLSGFGIYSYTIALMAYPLMLISFGFDMSATVTIVGLKGNKERIKEYITSIYVLKIIFLLVSSIALLAFLYLMNVSGEQILYVVAMFPMLIGAVLTSVYIFQSFDCLKVMSIITVIFRILTIPAVFLFVNTKNDIIDALLIQSLCMFFIGFFSFIYLQNRFYVFITRIDFKMVRTAFFDSYVIFKSSCASSVYVNLIPILVGIMHSYEAAGIYNAANTIKNIVQNFINVFFRVLFPRISRNIAENKFNETKKELANAFIIIVGVVFIGCIVNLLVSNYVIDIISGKEFENASIVLKILMFTVLASAINNFFGVQTLLPLGYKELFGQAVIKGAFVSIIIILPTVYMLGPIGGAISSVTSELIVFYLLIEKHKQLNLNYFSLKNLKENLIIAVSKSK